MKWFANLDEPTDREFRGAFIPKPQGFSGNTYLPSVSNIRLTGDPQFIETIAGSLKPFQNLEVTTTRVEINLQRTEDCETGEEPETMRFTSQSQNEAKQPKIILAHPDTGASGKSGPG